MSFSLAFRSQTDVSLNGHRTLWIDPLQWKEIVPTLPGLDAIMTTGAIITYLAHLQGHHAESKRISIPLFPLSLSTCHHMVVAGALGVLHRESTGTKTEVLV